MAELTPKERLQPSLLDRLTDDEPDKQQESRDKRVLSMTRLRESVLRDVSWLLNCDSYESVNRLNDYPEVKSSVVNYGIRNLAGSAIAGVSLEDIEKELKRAITYFEPRILAETLSVRVFSTDEMNHHSLNFDIEASLWAQPLPLHLYLRTEINKITGDVNLLELNG